ncbi:MAG: SUMF1/EgtB/PvdO family nonheme iron enzyme [Verrucomicrobia bacterium]|nr:SUMF1/EgtB/PvdO family nonheme iron enzyme [Verrucomicrobiota bacterium]
MDRGAAEFREGLDAVRLGVALEEHPVVHVDLEDARAYARWAGKRLPTEEEWQYAAQGPSARVYPWGSGMLPNRCNGGETGGTTPVRQFPEGRSPFGIWDLCGNVWEWTESERTDGRTRFCIVKGGSFYSAKGSGWYMDGGPRPNAFGAKFLMLWPGLDRCATVGFRCAADLSGTALNSLPESDALLIEPSRPVPGQDLPGPGAPHGAKCPAASSP